jgi:hypothetical protein
MNANGQLSMAECTGGTIRHTKEIGGTALTVVAGLGTSCDFGYATAPDGTARFVYVVDGPDPDQLRWSQETAPGVYTDELLPLYAERNTTLRAPTVVFDSAGTPWIAHISGGNPAELRVGSYTNGTWTFQTATTINNANTTMLVKMLFDAAGEKHILVGSTAWAGTPTSQPEIVYARTAAGAWQVYRYANSLMPRSAMQLGSDGLVRATFTGRSSTSTAGSVGLLTSTPGATPEVEYLAYITGINSDALKPRPMVHYSGAGRPELYINGVAYYELYDAQYAANVWTQGNWLSIWNTSPQVEEVFDGPNGDPMFLSTSGKLLQSHACVPSCSSRQCGADGCGGSCGQCGASETCVPAGLCLPYRWAETPMAPNSSYVMGNEIWLLETSSSGGYYRGGVGAWSARTTFPAQGYGPTYHRGNKLWMTSSYGTYHYDGSAWQTWAVTTPYASPPPLMRIDRSGGMHLFRRNEDTVYDRLQHQVFDGTSWGGWGLLREEYNANVVNAWFDSNNAILMHWEFGTYNVGTGTTTWSPRLWWNYLDVAWPSFGTVNLIFLDQYDRLNVIATSGAVDWYRRPLSGSTWEQVRDDFLPAYTPVGGRQRTFELGPDGRVYAYTPDDPGAPASLKAATRAYDADTGALLYTSYFYGGITNSYFLKGCPGPHYLFTSSNVAGQLW